jgi:hypothetical protein
MDVNRWRVRVIEIKFLYVKRTTIFADDLISTQAPISPSFSFGRPSEKATDIGSAPADPSFR